MLSLIHVYVLAGSSKSKKVKKVINKRKKEGNESEKFSFTLDDVNM